MFGGIRRRATFANITAVVALVVALSGSAYAVATVNSGDIVDDSIKSIDIKNNEGVKAVDIENAPSGADDVNASKLGGKFPGSFFMRHEDVFSTTNRINAGPNPSIDTLGIDGSVNLRASCENDPPVSLRLFITGGPGTHVTTDDGPVAQDRQTGRFYLIPNTTTRGYEYVSFVAVDGSGDGLRGMVGAGNRIASDCIFHTTLFRSDENGY